MRMNFLDVKFRQTIAKLLALAPRNVFYFERRLKAFAMIAIIAFPFYYFVWHSLFPQRYENLTLRLIGAALFVPILFRDRWPARLKRYLPHYWFVALLYALPFFFTYMLLRNQAVDVWIGSAMVALFAMIMLLDWFTLIVHFVLGVGLACAAYVLTSDDPMASLQHDEYLYIALFALVIGAVSNYESERIRIEQERVMLITAGSIAHELRTPLMSIRAGSAGLAKYLPALIEGYQMAKRQGLPVSPIRTAHFDALVEVLDHLAAEAYQSNVVIDMLLVNARLSGGSTQELVSCSISRCVDVALQRYPLSPEERASVSWDRGEDFFFRGVELLAVHVLFNLIKNALRHIAKAGKGAISIRLQKFPGSNRLIFRDTGGGIPPEALSQIFIRFYTSSSGGDSVLGAGIGLAFCRDTMRIFGGTIDCTSIYGEYSEFVLSFPKEIPDRDS